jgi:hypothetical protein
MVMSENLDPTNQPKKKEDEPAPQKCGVFVPSDTGTGWAPCGLDAITFLEANRQFKFSHSVQRARYLCVPHTEEAEPVTKEK